MQNILKTAAIWTNDFNDYLQTIEIEPLKRK